MQYVLVFFLSAFSRTRTKYGIYAVNLRLKFEYGIIRTRNKLRIWTLFTQCCDHLIAYLVMQVQSKSALKQKQ